MPKYCLSTLSSFFQKKIGGVYGACRPPAKKKKTYPPVSQKKNSPAAGWASHWLAGCSCWSMAGPDPMALSIQCRANRTLPAIQYCPATRLGHTMRSAWLSGGSIGPSQPYSANVAQPLLSVIAQSIALAQPFNPAIALSPASPMCIDQCRSMWPSQPTHSAQPHLHCLKSILHCPIPFDFWKNSNAQHPRRSSV